MAEQLPTMTIVYHNVLPGTLGGYAFLPFGDPTHPVSPQMWQTQRRGYGHYLSPTPQKTTNAQLKLQNFHPPPYKTSHRYKKFLKNAPTLCQIFDICTQKNPDTLPG
jgi:hypothetical protein